MMTGLLLGSLIGGRLGDRFGRKTVLTGSLVMGMFHPVNSVVVTGCHLLK
jgi:MFS family permease